MLTSLPHPLTTHKEVDDAWRGNGLGENHQYHELTKKNGVQKQTNLKSGEGGS
jgi:putative heme degradation protein